MSRKITCHRVVLSFEADSPMDAKSLVESVLQDITAELNDTYANISDETAEE